MEQANCKIEYLMIASSKRGEIDRLLRERWFSTEMVLRGEIVDLKKADCIAAFRDKELAGIATYRVDGVTAEILSLDSFFEKEGIGAGLIEQCCAAAKKRGAKKIVVVTTNDNTRAMRFYQKHNFELCGFRKDAMNVSRKLKPEIPIFGIDGIPIRDEIEFERIL